MVDVPAGPPVRSCCGLRHVGVQCPDGLVACCICFERVPVEALAREDGVLVDVCIPCARAERRELRGV